ncbi:putative phospholipid-transporting ATPase IIB-like, partial [Tropilaelaps mercedesae]
MAVESVTEQRKAKELSADNIALRARGECSWLSDISVADGGSGQELSRYSCQRNREFYTDWLLGHSSSGDGAGQTPGKRLFALTDNQIYTAAFFFFFLVEDVSTCVVDLRIRRRVALTRLNGQTCRQGTGCRWTLAGQVIRVLPSTAAGGPTGDAETPKSAGGASGSYLTPPQSFFDGGSLLGRHSNAGESAHPNGGGGPSTTISLQARGSRAHGAGGRHPQQQQQHPPPGRFRDPASKGADVEVEWNDSEAAALLEPNSGDGGGGRANRRRSSKRYSKLGLGSIVRSQEGVRRRSTGGATRLAAPLLSLLTGVCVVVCGRYCRIRRRGRASWLWWCCICSCLANCCCFGNMRGGKFTWCFSCFRRPELRPRQVFLGRESSDQKFPANKIRNQKYNLFTFIPLVLFHQFKFFLNLYFLAICLTQLIPDLRIGYPYTYYGPLLFVLSVTLIREAIDDHRRYRRDIEINSRKYKKLTADGVVDVHSAHIKVSDLIIVEKNQTVPADMVFLRTTEKNGTCFIRTDQLDGETDWKLRLAVPTTQRLDMTEQLVELDASVYAEEPKRAIHHFEGTFTRHDREEHEEPLAVENTLWANTVVASGTAVGFVHFSFRKFMFHTFKFYVYIYIYIYIYI